MSKNKRDEVFLAVFQKKTQIGIILILSISILCIFTVWFSANTIMDQIQTLWNLTDSDLAVLSMVLIFGFVAGGLVFSIFNLADILRTEYFYGLCGFFTALMNFISVFSSSFSIFLLLRFFTGFFIAGVYPTAMKLMSSWFKENRGFAVGILLGALAFGSGLPYILNLVRAEPDWRLLLSFSSIFSLVGSALVIVFIKEGYHISKGVKFKLSNVKIAWSNRKVRLANFAYFGHQWEVYAFWVWIPVYLVAVFNEIYPSRDSNVFVSITTFCIFLAGALGNIVGGKIADKIGKRKFSMIMLILSGSSSLIIGFFSKNLVVSTIIAIIWGFSIVPDSAQYSVMISEFTDQKLVGTSLTIQTTIGFAITTIPIQILPYFQQVVTWTFGFTFLSLGPIIGIVCLIQLKKLQENSYTK